jgi:hypothetical protein
VIVPSGRTLSDAAQSESMNVHGRLWTDTINHNHSIENLNIHTLNQTTANSKKSPIQNHYTTTKK